MALVVLLRGVNVGGHRRFRPAALAAQLAHLDVVNIGAAGTFVVRRPVGQTELRRELARRLPFETAVMICAGRDIINLIERNPFAGRAPRRDIVQFVSVLSRAPRLRPVTPLDVPSGGRWLLRILRTDGRFVVGLYRREMRAIACLGRLDRLFGAPATTRSWSTITAIGRVLERE